MAIAMKVIKTNVEACPRPVEAAERRLSYEEVNTTQPMSVLYVNHTTTVCQLYKAGKMHSVHTNTGYYS